MTTTTAAATAEMKKLSLLILEIYLSILETKL